MGKKIVSMLGEQSGRMTAMGLLVTLTVTMVLAGAIASSAEAATMSTVKDTLTKSSPASDSAHTILFTTQTAIPASGHVVIEFDTVGGNDFDFASVTAGDVTFSGANASISVDTTLDIVRIENTSGGWAAGAYTATLNGTNKVNNPAAIGSYEIAITSTNAAEPTQATLDEGSTWVAIVDTVILTADVDSYFDFTILGVASGVTIDAAGATTASSSRTLVDFGSVVAGAAERMGSKLNARTNAASGFVVTVEQNHNMLASSGADIDAFIDGTADAGTVWQAPAATNGSEGTYGHLGLYSSDNTGVVPALASNAYFGLSGTTQKTVFSHPSPTTGGTYWGGTDVDGQNTATMLYQIQISDLQEPGHYASRLMYIGTATF